MQCNSCRFENMPGVPVCGRCGSPLGLQSMAVNVHPPRAGAWAKRLRRWNLFRPMGYELRDAGRAARDNWHHLGWRLEIPDTPRSVLARLIVPGWAHFRLGQAGRGRAFLGSYLALLLPALLLLGTPLGSALLGLAFGVHVASCVSVLHFGGVMESWGYWFGVGLVFVALLVGLYLPAGWLVSRVAMPIAINVNGPPFAAGDVVLCNPTVFRFREPRPGDVVLYDQPAQNVNLAPPRHGYIRLGEGARIDRILAGPGDAVVWKDGRLTVNGQPSPWQPLNPGREIPPLQRTIPPGHYLILPTAGPVLPEGLTAEVWGNLTVIPAERIRGRVYFRSQPLNRLQWIS